MKSNVLALCLTGALVAPPFLPGNIQPAKAEIDKIMTAEEILNEPQSLIRAGCVLGWILNRLGKDLHSPKRIQELADSWWEDEQELDEPLYSSRDKALEQVIEYSKAIKLHCPNVN